MATVADTTGSLAKLLSRDCVIIVAEAASIIVGAAMITIGKHAATDGFNTCFVDGLAIIDKSRAMDTLGRLTEFVCTYAGSCKCDWVVGDTPNKKLASIMEQFGFRSAPMIKLRRRVSE